MTKSLEYFAPIISILVFFTLYVFVYVCVCHSLRLLVTKFLQTNRLQSYEYIYNTYDDTLIYTYATNTLACFIARVTIPKGEKKLFHSGIEGKFDKERKNHP